MAKKVAAKAAKSVKVRKFKRSTNTEAVAKIAAAEKIKDQIIFNWNKYSKISELKNKIINLIKKVK